MKRTPRTLLQHPWQWILLAGGLFALVVGSVWMGLALGALAVLWARRKLAGLKDDGGLPHVNHRWLIRRLQPWRFAERLNGLMPYPARQRHSLYLGRSGSGKSMMLKARIVADLRHKGGVLLLDAHGDLAAEIARLRVWEKHPGRLVHLSPVHAPREGFPAFNPFSIPGNPDPQLLSNRVSELTTAFEALLRDEFTHHQRLMLKRCIALLLHRGGRTILDLERLIRPGGEAEALELSRSHPDPELRAYFEDTFPNRKMDVTRHAVAARLGDVLENRAVRGMLGQPRSSFNLTGLLAEGKVVLLDLSQAVFGPEGVKVIGALILAEVGAYALRRANAQHRPGIWVYADESPLYVTSTISKYLSETRKYRVYFSLACQHLSQFQGAGMERLRDAVLANSGVKVVGAASQRDLIALAREMAFDPSEVRSRLRPGTFVLATGGKPPVLYSAPDYLVLSKKEMAGGNRHHLPAASLSARLDPRFYVVTEPSLPSSDVPPDSPSVSPPPLDPL